IPTVNDSCRADSKKLFGSLEYRLQGAQPTTSYQERATGGRLDYAPISVDVVSWIRLDHIGSHLDGLPDERGDLDWIPVGQVATTVFVGSHHQRFYHQRDLVTVTI